MATSIVSGKWWVVIPRELRERYGLKKGERVHFVDYGGVIVLIPVSGDPVKKGCGMLKQGTSLTEALLQSRREDAAHE